MTLCRVQEPDGRHGIEADGVEAIRGHRGEIPLDHVGLGYLGSVCPRSERSVGHAADVELLVADEEKLAVDAWPSCGLNNGSGSRKTIARAMPGCCTNGERSFSDRSHGDRSKRGFETKSKWIRDWSVNGVERGSKSHAECWGAHHRTADGSSVGTALRAPQRIRNM